MIHRALKALALTLLLAACAVGGEAQITSAPAAPRSIATARSTSSTAKPIRTEAVTGCTAVAG
jgi:hypothetical protein